MQPRRHPLRSPSCRPTWQHDRSFGQPVCFFACNFELVDQLIAVVCTYSNTGSRRCDTCSSLGKQPEACLCLGGSCPVPRRLAGDSAVIPQRSEFSATQRSRRGCHRHVDGVPRLACMCNARVGAGPGVVNDGMSNSGVCPTDQRTHQHRRVDKSLPPQSR